MDVLRSESSVLLLRTSSIVTNFFIHKRNHDSKFFHSQADLIGPSGKKRRREYGNKIGLLLNQLPSGERGGFVDVEIILDTFDEPVTRYIDLFNVAC